MTTVLLGSNRFIDCETLIGLKGSRLLTVETAPLRISLVTPPDFQSKRIVNVHRNEPRPGNASAVRVVTDEHSVGIFWEDKPLVNATLLDPETVSLRLDFKTIGMNVYDNVSQLFIGPHTFTTSNFTKCGTAIMLR